jgi:exonuclease VII small subunit
MEQFNLSKLNETIDQLELQSKQIAPIADIYQKFIKLVGDFEQLKSSHSKIVSDLRQGSLLLNETNEKAEKGIELLGQKTADLENWMKNIDNGVQEAIGVFQKESKETLVSIQQDLLKTQDQIAQRHQEAFTTWRSESKQQIWDLEHYLDTKIQELHSDYVVKMRAEGEQIQRGVEIKLSEIALKFDSSLKEETAKIRKRQRQNGVLIWLLVALVTGGLIYNIIHFGLR